MPLKDWSAPPRWPPLLPIGAMVRCEIRGWIGVVKPYDPRWAAGQFPVRWRNGIWEIMTSDYIALIPDTPDTGVPESAVRGDVMVSRHE